MSEVIGVKFRCSGRLYYFGPAGGTYERGDQVIVETARGREMGRVVAGNREVDDEELVLPLKEVIRRATDEDIANAASYKEKEADAFRRCKEKIRERGLEMKLVEAEYTFDGSKVIFYFTADGRVDFRELVKDLASMFRTRIELRQIGVRDETMIRGGIGCCGRCLCCSGYLNDFVSVSIKMAKEQNLSLNPTKISGVCGRLMCCLKYEEDTYEFLNSQLPRVGESVTDRFEGLKGTVTELNILRQKVKVRVELSEDETEIREYDAADLRFRRRGGAMPEAEPTDGTDAELAELEAMEEADEQESASEEEETGRRRRNRRDRRGRGRGDNQKNAGAAGEPAGTGPEQGRSEDGDHEGGRRPKRNSRRERPDADRSDRHEKAESGDGSRRERTGGGENGRHGKAENGENNRHDRTEGEHEEKHRHRGFRRRNNKKSNSSDNGQ